MLSHQRDCETDVWISKLWLFYVNRNVMILPRLKYFESPAAATIQASVCLPSSLSFRISDSTSENIFATWIYFCIHHKIWIMNTEPWSHIVVSTQAVYTEAQYWVHISEWGWLSSKLRQGGLRGGWNCRQHEELLCLPKHILSSSRLNGRDKNAFVTFNIKWDNVFLWSSLI